MIRAGRLVAGDLDTATLLALSVTQFTPAYESALVAASQGDGSQLRTLAREFVVDIDGAPLVDAQWAITCNDTVDHPGPRAAGTLARTIADRIIRLDSALGAAPSAASNAASTTAPTTASTSAAEDPA